MAHVSLLPLNEVATEKPHRGTMGFGLVNSTKHFNLALFIVLTKVNFLPFSNFTRVQSVLIVNFYKSKQYSKLTVS